MDILQDLLHWCTGWVDWNLILDITGGPNHLGNRCDAHLIADPKNVKGYGTLVMQASYADARRATTARLHTTFLSCLLPAAPC